MQCRDPSYGPLQWSKGQPAAEASTAESSNSEASTAEASTVEASTAVATTENFSTAEASTENFWLIRFQNFY